MLQRKVLGCEQTNLPWAILEVEGHNCKLSLSFDEETGEIIELGFEHNDILYAPNVLGQVVNGVAHEVRIIFSYHEISVPLNRVQRVNDAVADCIALCKECEQEGVFTIVA